MTAQQSDNASFFVSPEGLLTCAYGAVPVASIQQVRLRDRPRGIGMSLWIFVFIVGTIIFLVGFRRLVQSGIDDFALGWMLFGGCGWLSAAGITRYFWKSRVMIIAGGRVMPVTSYVREDCAKETMALLVSKIEAFQRAATATAVAVPALGAVS